MTRQTRLYQETGSPLIQGSSKHERPNWHAWAGAFAADVAVGAAIEAALVALGRDVAADAGLLAAYAAGAFVASLLGVVVGRSWGAKRRWLVGAVWGFLTGALCVGLLAYMAARTGS